MENFKKRYNRYIGPSFTKLRRLLSAAIGRHSRVAARYGRRASDPGQGSVAPALDLLAPADPANGAIPPGSPAEEAIAGTESYLAVLTRIHAMLCPQLYLEIGMREGNSLRLACGPAIGIDPDMRLTEPEPTRARLYRVTSDEFFERHAEKTIERPIDLAFIDGLHLFEYVLRDFANVERRASRCGLIVVDDIFPNHPVQGSRFRRTRSWTGDVWRLLICLSEQRPDLVLLPLDCAPTGLLLIAGLDPDSHILSEQYTEIARRYLSEQPDVPPTLLHRAGALDAGSPLVTDLLHGLHKLRGECADLRAAHPFLDGFRGRYRYRSEA
jgi:Methyltransferase domain